MYVRVIWSSFCYVLVVFFNFLLVFLWLFNLVLFEKFIYCDLGLEVILYDVEKI